MDPTIRVREADSTDRDLLMGFHQSLYQQHRDHVVPEHDLPLIEYRYTVHGTEVKKPSCTVYYQRDESRFYETFGIRCITDIM